MGLSREQKIEKIRLLEEKQRRIKQRMGMKAYSDFYDWQRDFNAATLENDACLLMAANQVGKSLTGCTIDAIHLTGDYPDDWEGFKFKKAPLIWCLGYSGEKTRDLLQAKLFGEYNTLDRKFEGGLVPKDRILDQIPMGGTPRAMREVKVKHASGGTAVCQFWSYSQGQHALMGDVVDWYHIDEEPEDVEIYPQVLTRTINGDQGRGGRGILTFTPENGKTELVSQFMDEEVKGQYLQTATWDQCPHMTPEKKEKILAKYPAYQKDMRSKGTPLMGAGLIYEVSEDQIKVDPFPIPPHWYLIDGMDFGWDHPQAHVQMLWDRDADCFYIVNAWKKSKKQPYEAWNVIKSWSRNVPTAWPSDGLQTEKGSAKQQKSYYEEAGFWMLEDHAQWEEGGNGVWAGIVEINDLMKNDRFKIFSHLTEVFEEIRQYHTKTTKSGKSEIVKLRDDLLDAIRYAYMMRRFAIPLAQVIALDGDEYEDEYEPEYETGRNSVTGY